MISSANPLCLVFFFFWIWTIFKVFIGFVIILLLFYVLVFWPRGMWDLSFLTRDQTPTSCIGRPSLNCWTTREVPEKLRFLTQQTSDVIKCIQGGVAVHNSRPQSIFPFQQFERWRLETLVIDLESYIGSLQSVYFRRGTGGQLGVFQLEHQLSFEFRLLNIYLLLCTRSQLQHAGSSVFIAACGMQFPDQGLNPGPLHWECGVLATGPPGKTQFLVLKYRLGKTLVHLAFLIIGLLKMPLCQNPHSCQK